MDDETKTGSDYEFMDPGHKENLVINIICYNKKSWLLNTCFFSNLDFGIWIYSIVVKKLKSIVRKLLLFSKSIIGSKNHIQFNILLPTSNTPS